MFENCDNNKSKKILEVVMDEVASGEETSKLWNAWKRESASEIDISIDIKRIKKVLSI